jgi:EAL domain-containing protein (putative c-di-GMP-specific phosphodiesterase class I)
MRAGWLAGAGKVKIDPVFVARMGSEREKARLASGLVGLGQGLGLAVAASGIVSQGDSASSLFSGCHEGQGDWVGIPASADGTGRFASLRCLHARRSGTHGRIRNWHF